MRAWLVVLLAGMMAQTAAAQRGGGSFPMQRADANGDGKVSWAEVQQTAPRFQKNRFDEMDRNGDGFLSKEDVPKRPNQAHGGLPQGEALIAILRKADTDGNNEVTKQELQKSAPRLARSGFTRLDTNKDGVISEADFRQPNRSGAPTPQAIRKADANGDGFWSFAEIKTVARQLPKPMYDDADQDGDGLLNAKELQGLRRAAERGRNQPRGNTQQADVRKNTVAKVLQSDANGDGRVTYEELSAAKPGYPRANFDRFDRNKDGVISGADVS